MDSSEVVPVNASRRTVLMITGAVGVAAAAGLAGCGSSASTAGTAPSSKSPGAENANAPAAPIAKTSDIPVGGGMIFAAQKIVVTQPTANDFKAFTAICTHLGCTVGAVANGLIMCPCHGSEYSIIDGSVKRGPAPSPLAAKQVAVAGDAITVTG